MGIGIFALEQVARLRIAKKVTLRRPGNAVSPVQPGVKPLWRVGRAHLVQQHVRKLVVERLGVFLGVKIAMTLAPVSPAAGEAIDDLPGRLFRASDDVSIFVADGVAVAVGLRHAGLAEVFAHHDVCGQLTPRLGNHGVFHLKHHRTVRIGDAADALVPFDGGVNVLSGFCETARDFHCLRVLPD